MFKTKFLSPTENKDECNVLCTQFSNELEMDDFVWITNPSENVSRDQKDSDNINTERNTMQFDSSSQTSKEIVPQCDSECIKSSNIDTEQCDKELLVEQHYWDQRGSSVARVNDAKKHPTIDRMSMKLYNVIAAGKAVTTDPSYFNMDRSTTATLKMLIKENYVGRFHNVVARGNECIVIHADCPYVYTKVLMGFHEGNAVKIHKLSRDPKKNMAILQRTQREYEHLLLLNRFSGIAPYVVYKRRNIIIMGFEGDDQETAPSISSLPADRFEGVYNTIVSHMRTWYKETHLVHGRLSAEKIVYRIYTDPFGTVRCHTTVLGWSHSVRADHPQAIKKLTRDCLFITKFFESRGVAVKATAELFKEITGVDKISNALLEVLNDKRIHQSNPNRDSSDKKSPIGNSRFK